MHTIWCSYPNVNDLYGKRQSDEEMVAVFHPQLSSSSSTAAAATEITGRRAYPGCVRLSNAYRR